MEQLKPRISVYYAQNATIVTLTDEKLLEEDDIKALEESIMPLVDGSPINLVIDFSNVQFLSSAVLGLLIRISKKISENKGRLKFCCINSKIFDIFKITRLDEIFEIYDDAKKALQSLK